MSSISRSCAEYVLRDLPCDVPESDVSTELEGIKCRHLFHEDVGASYQVILPIVIDDIVDCGAAMSGVAGFGMASELAATLASQALQENGLPPGLLPLQEVVQSTDTRTGPFQVKLSHSVERNIHGNLVRYSSEVRGTICRGKITNLKGVHVRSIRRNSSLRILTSASETLLLVAIP
ncbi:unnamed protein product [Closterium sp. Yama58-4]|nr:unnamed protein product [Closterium sp. Yama58-4]